jgi:hypothetical protein
VCQQRKDVLRRLLVDLRGELGGHLLVAGCRLPFRDRLRSLPETVDEVLVVLLRTTERGVGAIYASISCFRVLVPFDSRLHGGNGSSPAALTHD